tara:strand:- start:1687 stop:2376 length:690 start_codon:yes stop_codon:yes gene_type:complete
MSTSIAYQRDHNTLERLVRHWAFWLGFMALAFCYPIYRSVNRELPPELPKLYQVPEFQLTNDFNKPFGSEQLNGKVYIANFMFTSCPTTCPALMEKMQQVQKRIRGVGSQAALVTFTVDPETDTPQSLHKFARGLNANPFVWSFLTGDESTIKSVLIDGYKVPMGDGKQPIQGMVDGKEVTLFDIVHSEKLVLVDQEGWVRGYYSTDRISIDRLMVDLGLTMNRHLYNK